MATLIENFGSLLLWAMLAAHPAQDKEISVESWKTGSGSVQEQILNLSFDAKKRHYQTKIKDSKGKVRYDLIVDCTLADKHSLLLSMCSVRFVQRRFLLGPVLDTDGRYNLLSPHMGRGDYIPPEDTLGDFFLGSEFEEFFLEPIREMTNEVSGA